MKLTKRIKMTRVHITPFFIYMPAGYFENYSQLTKTTLISGEIGTINGFRIIEVSKNNKQ